MNWNKLKHLHEPTWINKDDLFKLLLCSEEMHLSGWASEGDPVFKSLESVVNDHVTRSMGGLCINDVVCVFLYDPSDGYRSSLSEVLVVPHTKLATTFSPVPIRAVPSDTKRWDNPQSEYEPDLLDLVARDIDKCVVQLGTDYSDCYYPNSIFYLDAKTLDEAIPLAVHRILNNAVGNWSKSKSVRKL